MAFAHAAFYMERHLSDHMGFVFLFCVILKKRISVAATEIRRLAYFIGQNNYSRVFLFPSYRVDKSATRFLYDRHINALWRKHTMRELLTSSWWNCVLLGFYDRDNNLHPKHPKLLKIVNHPMVIRNDLFNDLMSPPVGIPGGFRRAKVGIVFQMGDTTFVIITEA